MPILDVCGTNYQYPDTGDQPWGTEHIDWATAVSSCLTAVDAAAVTDPMTAQGDIIYNDASLDPERLAIGALNEVLTVGAAGIPEWQPAAMIASPLTTDGDIFIQAAGVDARLGIGAQDQVLTVDAGLPTWQTFTPGTGDVVGPPVSVDENIPVFDGTTGKLIKLSGVNIDSSNDVTGPNTITVGNGLGTGTDPDIIINKDTGDAGIRLQVNNDPANAWDIYNDNSDNDDLTFAYNGDVAFEIDEVVDTPIKLQARDIAASSTPTANSIYPHSIIKAWANTSSGGTIQDGLNLSVSKTGTGEYTYTFGTNMANANYAVVVTPIGVSTPSGVTVYTANVSALTSSGFQVDTGNVSEVTSPNVVNVVDREHCVMVIGTQS